MRNGREFLISAKETLRQEVTHLMDGFRAEMGEVVVRMGECFHGQLQLERRGYEQEILELRSEIERQYQVMANMRKEVEDLEELMIMQNARSEQQS
jgi:hypothetical protein